MSASHKVVSGSASAARYDWLMEMLVTKVGGGYLLGISVLLTAVVFYIHGRFKIFGTDVAWLKGVISELAINAENVSAKLFRSGPSPSLTAAGYHVLQRSGLKSYIDTKRSILLTTLKARTSGDPHAIQQRAFRLVAELSLEDAVERHLNTFALNNGLSADLLRRVGAIYLRDIAIESR